jgi:SAM-dependent methyltransferase
MEGNRLMENLLSGQLRSIARHFMRRIHLDRLVLNDEVRKLVDQLPVGELDALEISGTAWQSAGFRTYESQQYPEYDICEGPLPRQFDLIIADQVFEHLLWPYRAACNVHQMLRPGGHFLLATPFLQKVHECPHDCTRWTETGLKHLLAECGFPIEMIVTGSWGNRMAAKANLNPKKFPTYSPLLHRNLTNDPQFPVQVWALAIKSAKSRRSRAGAICQ